MTPRLLCRKAILITVNHITLEDKLVSELLIFLKFFFFSFNCRKCCVAYAANAPAAHKSLQSEAKLEKIVQRVFQKSARSDLLTC